MKGNGFRDPKRLQPTSAPLRASDRNADVAIDAPLLALRHPNPHEGLELDRAHTSSRNRTRAHRSERHLPESASSQKHEHDPRTPEPRTRRRLFSADTLPRTGPRAAKHLNQAGASKAPVSRAGERPVSLHARRRGQLKPAERSLVAARRGASVLVHADARRTTEIRFEPPHANEATLCEP